MKSWWTRLQQQREGFTLIEMLLVVAIIALLTAFALPKVTESIKNSKGVTGDNDLAVIGGAMDRLFSEVAGYPVAPVVPAGGVSEATKTLGEPAEKELRQGLNKYLRKTSPMKNGYGQAYMYISDPQDPSVTFAAGATPYGRGFVLVDPKDYDLEDNTLYVYCKTRTYNSTTKKWADPGTMKSVFSTDSLADFRYVQATIGANESMEVGTCEARVAADATAAASATAETKISLVTN